MEYNCFTPNEHDENWSHGDDLCGAADFIQGSRMDGSDAPTLFMELPEEPSQ